MRFAAGLGETMINGIGRINGTVYITSPITNDWLENVRDGTAHVCGFNKGKSWMGLV
jgi:hypothetical protein